MNTFFSALLLFLPFQFALNIAPSVDLSILRVVIVFLFVILAFKSLLEKKVIIPIDWQTVLVISFLTINVFSLFFAQNIEFGLRKILFIFSIFPLYFITAYIIRNASNFWFPVLSFTRYLVWGGLASLMLGFLIFFSQFVFGINAILDFYSYVGRFFWGNTFSESVLSYQSFLVNMGGTDYIRMSSLFPDPHNFALYLGMIFFLALAVAGFYKNSDTKNKQGSYAIIATLCVLGILLSFSRAAYLALLFSATVVFILYFITAKEKILSGKIILVALFLSVILSVSPIKDRFLDIFSKEDGSSTERVQILKDGLNIFKDNWLFGVGIGNAPLAYNENIEYRNPTNSHNTYLEVAIESGVLGLVVWLLLIFGTIIQLIKTIIKREGDQMFYALGLVGALLFFAIHSFFEVFLYSPINLSVLMILLAMSAERLGKNNKNQ